VKCDEKQPTCLRCSNYGLECHGYETSERSEKEKSAVLPTALQPRPRYLPDIGYIVQNHGWSTQERRVSDFFESNTSPILAEYYDIDFWNQLLLQICHSEKTVLHVVLALGALHEEEIMAESDRKHSTRLERRSFALKQYNQAVHRLSRQLEESNDSIEVTLISCVLFVCLELLLRNMQGAITHLQNGVQLIQAWKDENSTE